MSEPPIGECIHALAYRRPSLMHAHHLRLGSPPPLGRTCQTHGALEGEQPQVVIDNFEHVLVAAPLIANLVAPCASLRVLATSREALHLSGEHVDPVAPL